MVPIWQTYNFIYHFIIHHIHYYSYHIVIMSFYLLFFLIYLTHQWCFKMSFADTDKVRALDYSDDDAFLVTGSDTGTVTIYDTYTYIPVGTYTRSGRDVESVKFSPDGNYIAIGYDDSTVKILETTTYTQYQSLSTAHSKVYELDFLYDSSVLLTCGDDKTFKVWSTTTWTTVSGGNFDTGQKIFACKFRHDGEIVLGQEGGYVSIISSTDYTTINSNTSYGGNIEDVDVRWGTSTYLAANRNSKGFTTLSLTEIYDDSGELKTCSYSRTLEYFVFSGNSNRVALFNGTNENNTKLVEFNQPGGNVYASRFSHNGYFLAIGSDDNNVYIYSQYCMTCQAGQYYNITNLVCTECVEEMTGCGHCYISSECVECLQGFYLNQTTKLCETCKESLIGCAMCESSTQCIFCYPGFYLKADKTCENCQIPMTGCSVCNSSTYCSQCNNDYYLNFNLCEPCTNIQYCLLCNSPASCLQCELGYYLTVGNTCQVCPQNCLTCVSNTNCTSCIFGYYPSAGSCVRCSGDCLGCDETDFCFSCPSGMYVDGSGACQPCTSPCITCNDTSFCLSCELSYYLDMSGGCSRCSENCLTCNSSSECLSCNTGYYFTSFACEHCAQIHSFCSSCNITDCFSCQIGYYLNGGSCSSCSVMHYCLSCSSSTQCESCGPGYYLSNLLGNDSCQPCPTGCSTCIDNTVCIKCLPGFYESSGSCLACGGYCITCSSSSTCLSCGVERYLNGNSCDLCSNLYSNCLSCSSSTCFDCSLGYFLNGTNLCQKCTPACTSCNSTSCLSCELGYYLALDDTCQICLPSCGECSSAGVCESCVVGYYLSATSCLPCLSIGCITCNSSTTCLSCTGGYYLTLLDTCDACQNAIENCLFCESQIKCLSCSYGYFLSANNQTCESCSSLIQGCIDCSSETNCLNCEDGFKLSTSNLCQPCQFGCSSCNSTHCLQCLPSFQLNVFNGVCDLCSDYLQGCQICTDNMTCINCQSGFYLNPPVCSLCRNAMIGCLICDDSSTCTACQEGYYLDVGSCEKCSNILGCQLCTIGFCYDCQNGYYESSGVCLPCSSSFPGCLYCNGTSACLSCKSGFYLDGSSTCSLCSSQMVGCIFCNSDTVCTQCQGGYYLDSSTFQCVKCSEEGCEVCLETNSSSCVTCNSKYYYDAGNCFLCRNSISGCVQCSTALACSECDVGFYTDVANNNNSCLLCSSAMAGCSICSSSTVCLECKSLYFLNSSSQCQLCSDVLTGCSFCVSTSACLACQSGYYLNSSSLCQPCTDITGCLVCQDAATCLFCQSTYYFNNYQCASCSVLTGCYSCISSTVCSSCASGYALNAELKCDAVTFTAEEEDVEDLVLKTYYVNETCLQHILYAKGMSYTQADVDWIANANLFLTKADQTQITLQIKKVQWGTNAYTLIFYTTNPTNITEESINKMNFVRRLLSASINTGFSIDLVLSQSAIDEILPNYNHQGSLSLSYNLDDPTFYASYVKGAGSYQYHIFGIVMTGIIFVLFTFKALYYSPTSIDQGQIIPHIFSMKVGALILFPTYIEYINYASGFMTADFPWANDFFSASLSNPSDTTPLPYSVFYANLNLASQYLLAFCVILFFCILTFIIGRSCQATKRQHAYYQFLYCFFVFGVAFMGCACLQGAILNPINEIDVNGVFYIFGIILYCLLFMQCLYRLIVESSKRYCYKIRIFIKASLLSLAHLSPIYLLSAAICVDVIISIIQFRFSKLEGEWAHFSPKLWLFNQTLCNIAVLLIVLVPEVMISILLASIMIVVVLIDEIYIHYKEYAELKKKGNMEEKKNENIWDFDMKEENQSNINIANETLYSNSNSKNESGAEMVKKGKRGKNFKPKKAKGKDITISSEYEFNFTYEDLK